MDENIKDLNRLTERTLPVLGRKDAITSKGNIRSWRAWLTLGLVAGIFTGAVFVPNKNTALALVRPTATLPLPADPSAVLTVASMSAKPAAPAPSASASHQYSISELSRPSNLKELIDTAVIVGGLGESKKEVSYAWDNTLGGFNTENIYPGTVLELTYKDGQIQQTANGTVGVASDGKYYVRIPWTVSLPFYSTKNFYSVRIVSTPTVPTSGAIAGAGAITVPFGFSDSTLGSFTLSAESSTTNIAITSITVCGDKNLSGLTLRTDGESSVRALSSESFKTNGCVTYSGGQTPSSRGQYYYPLVIQKGDVTTLKVSAGVFGEAMEDLTSLKSVSITSITAVSVGEGKYNSSFKRNNYGKGLGQATVSGLPAKGPAITIGGAMVTTIFEVNGGKDLTAGESYEIKWELKNMPADAKVKRFVVKQGDDIIADLLPLVSSEYLNKNPLEGQGSVTWSVPATLSAKSASVMVEIYRGGTYTMRANPTKTFKIISDHPSITVYSPQFTTPPTPPHHGGKVGDKVKLSFDIDKDEAGGSIAIGYTPSSGSGNPENLDAITVYPIRSMASTGAGHYKDIEWTLPQMNFQFYKIYVSYRYKDGDTYRTVKTRGQTTLYAPFSSPPVSSEPVGGTEIGSTPVLPTAPAGTLTATISASPKSVVIPASGPNASSTIAWRSTNAASCTVDLGGGVTVSGEQTSGKHILYFTKEDAPKIIGGVSIPKVKTVTLSCSGNGGTKTASTSIALFAGSQSKLLPTVTLSAGPTTPPSNQIRFTWSSTNATSCTLTGGEVSSWNTLTWKATIVGALADHGSQNTPVLTKTGTYIMKCMGAGGTGSSAPVMVKVDGKNVTTSVVPPSSSSTSVDYLSYLNTVISTDPCGALSVSLTSGASCTTSKAISSEELKKAASKIVTDPCSVSSTVLTGGASCSTSIIKDAVSTILSNASKIVTDPCSVPSVVLSGGATCSTSIVKEGIKKITDETAKIVTSPCSATAVALTGGISCATSIIGGATVKFVSDAITSVGGALEQIGSDLERSDLNPTNWRW